jgi:hypothetical protein
MNLVQRMSLVYKKEGLDPLPTDRFVVDARNARVFGPYRHEDAVKMAHNLCQMVAQDTLSLFPGAVATGPFYVFTVDGRKVE